VRIIRVRETNGNISHGLLEDGMIRLIVGDIFGRWSLGTRQISLEEASILAPVAPASILAIGRNYRDHAAESDDQVPESPLLFIKAATALNHPETPIVLPLMAPDEVDFEAELAVVIGKTARDVSEAEAQHYILGYTCANDVSARDCQFKDGQWARGKSFDTFAPLGPWIETDFVPGRQRIRGRLNGAIMQDAELSQMVFGAPFLVSYLSNCMTLPPGTVILTGTPAGCGFARKPPAYLRPGDVYEVEIEGLGSLRNPVVAAALPAASK
jgi:2-keto-4-pentenoate hydratase/2-oxohepta-3-ene-1,7-dioic acid hydratase in catechol pathway